MTTDARATGGTTTADTTTGPAPRAWRNDDYGVRAGQRYYDPARYYRDDRYQSVPSRPQ